MERVKKVLILSANLGAGHLTAAEAVKQALVLINPHIEGTIINSYRYGSSTIGKMVEGGYLQMVKMLPTLYGFIYERQEKATNVSGMKNWLCNVVAQDFKELIDNYKPDVIVSTHTYPCGISSVLREKFNVKVPMVAVVTDFQTHPFWIYPNIDLYAVATHEIESQLIGKGIAPEKIKVTGIPIDPRFCLNYDAAALKKKLGIADKLPVLLVMGGGLGMGPVGKILRSLKKATKPMQVVVVVGKNKDLQKKLREGLKKLEEKPFKVEILGYVNNIYEYMKVSDLLVTKAGGLTLSEAMAVKLPMVIVNSIPGHEERNTRYLVSRRAAVAVEKEKDLYKVIEDLFGNRDKLQRMRERAEGLGKADSAERVAREIIKFMEKQKITLP